MVSVQMKDSPTSFRVPLMFFMVDNDQLPPDQSSPYAQQTWDPRQSILEHRLVTDWRPLWDILNLRPTAVGTGFVYPVTQEKDIVG